MDERREAFDVRSDADYDDYFIISKKEVQTQIEQAQFFAEGIKKYVEQRFQEERDGE